jgi:hypothetical protein
MAFARLVAAVIFAVLGFSTAYANQALQEGNGINPYVNNACNNTLPNSWVVWVEVIREGAVPNGTCVDTMPTAAQIVSKFNTQFGAPTSEFEAVWCNQLSTTWQINAGTGTTFYSGQAGTTSILVQAGQCVTMIYWLAVKTPGAEVVQIATNATAGTAKTPPTPITGAAPVTISAAALVNGYLWRQGATGGSAKTHPCPDQYGGRAYCGNVLAMSDYSFVPIAGSSIVDTVDDNLPTAAQIVAAAHGLTQFDVFLIVDFYGEARPSGAFLDQAYPQYGLCPGAGVTVQGITTNGGCLTTDVAGQAFTRPIHVFITNSTPGAEAVTISN